MNVVVVDREWYNPRLDDCSSFLSTTIHKVIIRNKINIRLLCTTYFRYTLQSKRKETNVMNLNVGEVSTKNGSDCCHAFVSHMVTKYRAPKHFDIYGPVVRYILLKLRSRISVPTFPISLWLK